MNIDDYREVRREFLSDRGATEDDVIIENGVEYIEVEEDEGEYDDLRPRRVHVPVPRLDGNDPVRVDMQDGLIHEARHHGDHPHFGVVDGQISEL